MWKTLENNNSVGYIYRPSAQFLRKLQQRYSSRIIPLEFPFMTRSSEARLFFYSAIVCTMIFIFVSAGTGYNEYNITEFLPLCMHCYQGIYSDTIESFSWLASLTVTLCFYSSFNVYLHWCLSTLCRHNFNIDKA